jgi:YVTN family beta-propeller protein
LKLYFIILSIITIFLYIITLNYSHVYALTSESNLFPVTIEIKIDYASNIAINPNTDKAYVTNSDISNVTVINSTTGNILDTIKLNGSPEDIAANPSTNKIYVASGSGIDIIDGETDELSKTINPSNFFHPVAIAINQNTNRIYSVNEEKEWRSSTHGSLTVNDGKTDKLIYNISVGNSPSDIDINSNTNKIYVADKFSNTVYVIDEGSGRLLSNITVGRELESLAIDSLDNKIYVLYGFGKRISIINGVDNKIINTYTTDQEVDSIYMHPKTNNLYVTYPHNNTLSIINAKEWNTTASILVHDATLSPIFSDIDYNPTTNTIYVVDGGEETVSIISNVVNIKKLERNDIRSFPPGINVGRFPSEIAIDMTNNKIYVLNKLDYSGNKISIIDGKTDQVIENDKVIENLSASYHYLDIDINTLTNWIYFLVDGQIHVRDPNANYHLLKNITGITENKLLVNPYENILYSYSFYGNILQVIDENTNTIKNLTDFSGIVDISFFDNGNTGIVVTQGGRIYFIDEVGNISDSKVVKGELNSIGVNDNTETIYITNSNGTVLILDPYITNNFRTNVKVSEFPNAITVNPLTNMIYIANQDANTISVIDGTTDKLIKNISVAKRPDNININIGTNRIYVTNSYANIVTIIDGYINSVVAGIKFNIHPPNSGIIKCGETQIQPNLYYRLNFETECRAISNKGFEFDKRSESMEGNTSKTITNTIKSDSWYNPLLKWYNSFLDSVGLKQMQNYDSSTFTVTKYGNFSANFYELPPPLPPEYWGTLFGVVASSIVGSWFIPGIISGVKAKLQTRKLSDYHNKMKFLSKDGKLDQYDIELLDKLKGDITDAYARGKITDQHYNILKEEISLLYEEIYKKSIDSANNVFDRIKKIPLLEKLKGDITDAYARGKITDQHYNLLKENISKYENNNNTNSKK